MCTPIAIEMPQIDLSKDPLAASPEPAGTGDPAPGTDTTSPSKTGTVVDPASAGPADTSGGTDYTDKAIGVDGPLVAPPKGGAGDPLPTELITSGGGPPAASDGRDGHPLPTELITSGGGPPAASDGRDGHPDTRGVAPPGVLDQNTLLINSLTDMAHRFTDTTAGILSAQSDAASALHSGFLDLNEQQKAALAAADQLRKNTGQASRRPNYSLSLSANRRANSKGNSSTMLTGSGGVPTNSLALGRAQLLGGAQ